MKRSEAARYSRWSALTALALAIVTGGIYLHRNWVAHVERTKAPPPLTADQERQSIGLTVSKNEGDRTIFTVKASKSTDLRGQDISLLEEVNVTVFGKLGDRHDVIHTHSCRYAKASGAIECSGEVVFDLQTAADAERAKNDKTFKPNVIHVETSGVTFNERLGRAETAQSVTFTLPNGFGEGVGGTYLSEDGVLRLEKDVSVTLHQMGALALGKNQNAAASDVVLRGSSMEMGKQSRKVVLAGPATATTNTQELTAGQMTMLLDTQNRAQTMIAEPGPLNQTPQVVSHGKLGPTGSGTLWADLLTAHLAPEGWVRTIDAQGNVRGKSDTGEMQAENAHVEMYPRVNQTKSVTLNGNVHVKQRDPKTQTARNLATAVLQMNFAGGKAGEPNPMQHAETLSRGTMEWTDTDNSQSKLAADKLAVDFAPATGKAKDMVATGNVQTERKLEGRPTQTATATNGDAQLDAGGSWTLINLHGNVHLKDGDRRAESQKALFTRNPQTTVLTGQAIARDESSETRAAKITFNQDTGDIQAEGKVRSTDYGNSKDRIHLSPQPSHVIAENMLGNSKTGRALYTGHARLWQGQSVLEADSIELLRNTRVLNAKGNVRGVFPKAENDGSTNAGAGKSKKTPAKPNASSSAPAKTCSTQDTKSKDDATKDNVVVWHVSSDTLTYWDTENRARLEKNVLVQTENERMKGPALDLYFTREGGDEHNGTLGASKISRAVGTGGVEVVQGDKRGTAEKGVYTADDDRFVLSGGTPTLYDADGGITTGRELTFNFADDTIIVDSGNGPRTLTRHRVQR
ncbi:MAG TPA: LptA/OstA family protein [Verrucomicrobiae bacterium]|nr:LptA/OstA family protein [Verrucomicrobiae bacterium]